MKLVFGFIVILVSALTLAQAQAQGPNEADMQKMMQQAQKMQACMANVDRSKLKALENKGRQLQAKIKEMCAAGKRDEAFSTAMREGMELANNPSVKEMRKCSDLMPDMASMMPNLPYADAGSSAGDNKDKSDKHICD
jgi:membrane-bound lytic murein transglycosylase